MKIRAAAADRTMERIVPIKLTPLWNRDLFSDTGEASFFKSRGEILVFIKPVYTEKINIRGRRS